MKAVGYRQSLPINDSDALMDIEVPQPAASGRDLLIRVKAIAVNPVDYKIRQRVPSPNQDHKIIGWDAVGEVVAVGNKVSLFKPGDWVFYAGDLNRPGCNAEFQVVDERLVGIKPCNLSSAEAAALPLTSITAWELMFDHLGLNAKVFDKTTASNPQVLLVVDAAGGVGSILIQLARTLTSATIVATASREESKAWVKRMGAHYVIDHRQPLIPQVNALGVGRLSHVASLTHSSDYMDDYIELLAPFGKIALIDDLNGFDLAKLKSKSLSLHYEFMFARSMHHADDMEKQGWLLNQISDLANQNRLISTIGESLGQVNAANLKKAHAILESGKAIGKLVLEW